VYFLANFRRLNPTNKQFMQNFFTFKKIILTVFVIGLCSLASHAQLVKLGLEGGFNITEPIFVYPGDSSGAGGGLKDHTGYIPFFGYFGGVFVKYQSDREANGWKFFAEIEKRTFKTALTPFMDPNTGIVTNPSVRDTYSNTYFNLGALYVIQQSDRFELGVGLCNHYLINSIYVNPYGPSLGQPEKTKNNVFKPDMLSIPLQATYNVGNAFTYLTFDVPVMSSARFGTTNFKTFQTVLQVGVGAFIRVVDK
jgi:hypothetical protein